MACLSRNPSNRFNFLRFRRVNSGTIADLPISELCPIQLITPIPQNLAATAITDERIDLTWEYVDNPLQFTLERKEGAGAYSVIASLSGSDRAYTDTGLTEGTNYTYRIKADNSEYSNEASATTFVPFTFTIDTTQTGTPSTSFQLPLVSTGTYDFRIDKGDGSEVIEITTWNQPESLLNYASSGTYTVKLMGTIRGWAFDRTGDRLKIMDVTKWGGFQPIGGDVFAGCENIDVSAVDLIDLSETDSLSSFFLGCESLIYNASISEWNLLGIRNIGGMFQDCQVFNQSLNSWDTSTVEIIDNLFLGASSFNQDLNDWDVSNVSSNRSAFNGASSFNQDLSAWDVSGWPGLQDVFNGALSFNQDLSAWNVSGLTDFRNAFRGASSFNNAGLPLNWNLGSGTQFQGMFNNSAFNQTLGIQSLTGNLQGMFSNCPYNQPEISNWNMSGVVNMSSMFDGGSINQNLSSWDMSTVENIFSMFRGCGSYNNGGQPLDWSDSSSLLVCSSLFRQCAVFNQPIFLDTSNASSFNAMFLQAVSFDQSLNLRIDSLNSMADMFTGASWSTGNLDAWLVYCANERVAGRGTDNIVFDAPNTSRTSASDAAVTLLTGTYGWTINTL